MNSKIKTTLLLLTLIAATIWLAGCKKSSDNPIVGTWNYNGYVAGFSYADTPYSQNSTNNWTTVASLTLNSNNTFTVYQTLHTISPFFIDTNTRIAGTYTYADDSLVMVDSRYPNNPIATKIITLNANTLTLFQTDTGLINTGSGPTEYFILVSHFNR